MLHETHSTHEKELTLNIVRGEINSVRSTDIVRTGCRAYDKKMIGVAGCFGEPSNEVLQLAEAHLQYGISYPWPLTKGIIRERDMRKEDLTDSEYLARAEKLMRILRKRFPQIVFSNKLRRSETEVRLTNDTGTNLVEKDRLYSVELIMKGINSINVMDDVLISYVRSFDPEKIAEYYAPLIAAFDNRVDLPVSGEMPVLALFDYFSGKFNSDLNGRVLGSGGSLFSSKVGSKLFADNFSLLIDKTAETGVPGSPFFDFEGSLLQDDRYYLIENGILHSGYADRRTASDFNVPCTAAAGGEYDDVPAIITPGLLPSITHSSVSDLLKEVKGPVVYATMMSGGDFTSEGMFASPVQTSYLVEDGQIIGRLPDLQLRGQITDLFGRNYIGSTVDEFLKGTAKTLLRAEIKKA